MSEKNAYKPKTPPVPKPRTPGVPSAWSAGVRAKQKYNKSALPGGRAAGKTPADFDADDLAAGTKVEMEHTTDRRVAQEIAMDHLTEDRDYYRKLRKVEKSAMTAVAQRTGRERPGVGVPLVKKPTVVERVKAAFGKHPGGAGWQAVPGGKKGGYRKRGADGDWVYWYPGMGSQGGTQQEAERHVASQQVQHHERQAQKFTARAQRLHRGEQHEAAKQAMDRAHEHNDAAGALRKKHNLPRVNIAALFEKGNDMDKAEQLGFGFSGPKPPPGYQPIQGSKHGGFVKVTGNRRSYWYPGEGESSSPKQSDVPREHTERHMRAANRHHQKVQEHEDLARHWERMSMHGSDEETRRAVENKKLHKEASKQHHGAALAHETAAYDPNESERADILSQTADKHSKKAPEKAPEKPREDTTAAIIARGEARKQKMEAEHQKRERVLERHQFHARKSNEHQLKLNEGGTREQMSAHRHAMKRHGLAADEYREQHDGSWGDVDDPKNVERGKRLADDAMRATQEANDLPETPEAGHLKETDVHWKKKQRHEKAAHEAQQAAFKLRGKNPNSPKAKKLLKEHEQHLKAANLHIEAIESHLDAHKAHQHKSLPLAGQSARDKAHETAYIASSKANEKSDAADKMTEDMFHDKQKATRAVLEEARKKETEKSMDKGKFEEIEGAVARRKGVDDPAAVAASQCRRMKKAKKVKKATPEPIPAVKAIPEPMPSAKSVVKSHAVTRWLQQFHDTPLYPEAMQLIRRGLDHHDQLAELHKSWEDDSDWPQAKLEANRRLRSETRQRLLREEQSIRKGMVELQERLSAITPPAEVKPGPVYYNGMAFVTTDTDMEIEKAMREEDVQVGVQPRSYSMLGAPRISPPRDVLAKATIIEQDMATPADTIDTEGAARADVAAQTVESDPSGNAGNGGLAEWFSATFDNQPEVNLPVDHRRLFVEPAPVTVVDTSSNVSRQREMRDAREDQQALELLTTR